MRSKAFAAFNAANTAQAIYGAVTVSTNRNRLNRLLLIPLLLFVAMFAFAGNTSADDGLTWPVKVDMLWPDADQSAPWHDVGDVIMHNDRDKNLTIEIFPDEGTLIRTVGIHVVDDPADFLAIMDKKGQKPKIPKLAFRTDYREAEEGLPAYHREVIALEELSDEHFCWGVNPAHCPPPYVIVHTQLQLPDGTIMDGVYAKNEAVFDRFIIQEVVLGDSKFWGFVTYPLAKHEAGHFIDANVMGLEYVTITESGITGIDGQFWYLPDERVAFSLGSLYLGDVLGGRRVSPADLFEGADMTDDRALNVARLLQSMDTDGNPAQGSINISETAVGCLDSVLPGFAPIPAPDVFFADDATIGALIDATVLACAGQEELAAVTKEEALENMNAGMQAGNLMKRNVSKTPELKNDKAKLEVMTVYVPAMTADDTLTDVVYYDEDGEILETRDVAKPIVVVYLGEVEDTGVYDVFASISRDDGDTWKRRNLSKTADKSSLAGYPGESQKPMLKVKDDKIFVAWTDKYCNGGRPGYAIKVCETFDVDSDFDGVFDTCEFCRETDEGTKCVYDYTGDDAYWQDDLFGIGGPQRTVIYEEYPEMGEVPYSCVWTARGVVESNGDIQWFKPEKLTSGRRDAYQLFAGAGTDVAFAIVWQEDPKGLMPGDGEGPGDGWSGANTNSKTDIWYSYITLEDFAKIDYNYPSGTFGEQDDMVDVDPELAGRVKALVPMSLPVRISDNEVCSKENMDPDGGHGDHDFDGEGEGTHRYCGELAGIGTALLPGYNPLCAYTVEKANPKGEIHNVCVTADGRLLDGNTGASRPNIFLQPYKKPDNSKSAWVIVGYEESKGVGSPPEGEHDDDGCGGGDDYMPEWPVVTSEEPDEDRYKPDMGKNVIYHSFDLFNPEIVGSGGIINLPETRVNDEGETVPVYLVDEFGELLLDWKGDPQLAYHNARRVRFITQPKSKTGKSGTVLVALYREGNEGRGKPADVFMRRISIDKKTDTGNPYMFSKFVPGAKNLSSVTPTVTFENPYDDTKPIKMLRWAWTHDNLDDSSAMNPFSDARAHRGALNGDDLIIGYSWTPNWGRRANDKYDVYVSRSFNGGQHWTTDPDDPTPIEHNVVFRVPVLDEVAQTVTWVDEVVTTEYEAGAAEPPRNVSNLRNNRISVMEPRLVKTPGTILTNGEILFPEDEWNDTVYQLAYGLEFNQNQLPDDVVYPKMPLDIYYSQTTDKGQRYQSVIVTPQGGSGRTEEGWNPLANDKPLQGAAQLRQTPDGSRMYGIWLEEGAQGSDILFRRVDYRNASQ
jgi:hypothetical protein